jgi:hypothetical protein
MEVKLERVLRCFEFEKRPNYEFRVNRVGTGYPDWLLSCKISCYFPDFSKDLPDRISIDRMEQSILYSKLFHHPPPKPGSNWNLAFILSKTAKLAQIVQTQHFLERKIADF